MTQEKVEYTTPYRLYGKTYDIKEELKSLGCHWNNPEKCWETPPVERDEFLYKRIKSLVEVFDIEMVPVRLSKECRKIQEIMHNFSKEDL